MTEPAVARLRSAPARSHLERWLSEFRERRPIRAGSLIVTVFGDSLLGDRVWLGDLIAALEPFGLNERLVRTAVYRLCGDAWLTSSRIGRRSQYQLSASGKRRFEIAAERIYRGAPNAWDGRWMLVAPQLLPDDRRDALQRELEWQGFGQLLPGLLAHPSADRRALDAVLDTLDCREHALVMEASTEDLASGRALQALARRCWDLDALAARYRRFLDQFDHELGVDGLSDEGCFQLRTLLIHEYRRILLRDSDLPDELLPDRWAGRRAAQCAARLYRACAAGAERFVNLTLRVEPRSSDQAHSFHARFGGL